MGIIPIFAFARVADTWTGREFDIIGVRSAHQRGKELDEFTLLLRRAAGPVTPKRAFVSSRLAKLSSRRDALLSDHLLPRFPHLEQFIEQRAVMHNRFAQLLSVCRPLLIAQGDGLRRAVICYNVGMVD